MLLAVVVLSFDWCGGSHVWCARRARCLEKIRRKKKRSMGTTEGVNQGSARLSAMCQVPCAKCERIAALPALLCYSDLTAKAQVLQTLPPLCDDRPGCLPICSLTHSRCKCALFCLVVHPISTPTHFPSKNNNISHGLRVLCALTHACLSSFEKGLAHSCQAELWHKDRIQMKGQEQWPVLFALPWGLVSGRARFTSCPRSRLTLHGRQHAP